MKNNTLMALIFLGTIGNRCSAMDTTKDKSEHTITSKTIQDSKPKFIEFLEKKNVEHEKLESWTSPDWILGPLVSVGIEIISPWTRYGKIEPEKTKAFLGRAFENVEQLKDAIDRLANSPENIEYLNHVLGELSPEVFRKRDLGKVAEAMRGKHHPGIPNTEKMATKNEKGQYIVPRKDFDLFAATNLWAIHYVDSQQRPSKKRGKRRNHSPQLAA